ncbi:hypothetical protein ALC62_15297 [Cyphomyrmex costatus]|uniref:Uncharacterized protein n=1 Tax=Cyphomyrmex costatus TaxID=456900 RepID=A0A151I7K6_9HYME|nr:hypothetical protein ALC62_15297 [Cyphomyrmex costatus]
MTDGHGRTNTVGHRAVRGQRMPPDPATPHATQHKPHRRRETRHMSGTTFEAANQDGRRRPPCATCRPSCSTFDQARHPLSRSNMAATWRSDADH